MKTTLLLPLFVRRFVSLTGLILLLLSLTNCQRSDDATPAPTEWILVSNGQIPANALKAGNESDGTPIYIARTKHEGGLHIGKARQGDIAAAIPYGGKELWLGNYEVYTGSGTWVAAVSGKTLPAGVIQGGNEPNGNRQYIGRAAIAGGIHPGKVIGTQAWIPYDGKEMAPASFSLLTSN